MEYISFLNIIINHTQQKVFITMNISYMLYIITINTQGVPTAEKTHWGREPSIYNNNNNNTHTLYKINICRKKVFTE